METASFGKQLEVLKVLPTLLAIPGGFILVNFCLFRVTRTLRKWYQVSAKILSAPWYSHLSLEEREKYSEELLDNAEDIRRAHTLLEEYRDAGTCLRFLVSRFGKYACLYSDLAETIALSADPEMAALGKELHDVL